MFRDTHHGKPCTYCRRLMDRARFDLQPTRDHIIPVSLGGTAKALCCHKCNGIKGDMLPEVWEAFMAANPGWWKMSNRGLSVARRQPFNRENVNGHREEGDTHPVAGVVGSPAPVG